MTGKWQVGKNQRTPSHSFIFSLRESAGLTPRQNPQGGIDFVNGQGQSVFGFDPPTVHDGSAAARAAGAVSLTLGQSSSGTTVTLTVDSTWLGNPGRVFPVVVDPDFTPHHPDRSCYIGSGSYANTNSCTSSELDLGYDGSNAFRTLLHFSVDYLEPNVQVDEAQLGLYVYHHSTNNTTPIGAYQLTHSWTNGVTWNTYDGTNPWTTPGGDFSATPAYTADGVGGSAGWVYWYPSRLVKSWVNGTQYESGFLLKEPSESVTNVMDAYSTSYSNSAYWPSLRIFWEPRLGDQPWHPMIRMNLTDRMNLGVNAANGNLYLHQQDLTMPGVGLDNTVDRYYNSKGFDLSSAQDLGAISEWRLGLMDTYSGVGAWDDGSVGFTDAGGTAWMFYQNPDDSYTPPPGIDAQLQFINGVGYKLTYNRSAKVLNFTGYGNTASVVDRSGITLAYAYNANHEPSQITDTLGKATTFGYSGTTITSITDPASRVYGYGYNGNNQLTSYTDANTKVTQYAYGTADPMTGHSVLTK
ncbi:MAG: DNRLRE domain-containing protein, partial [Chloroflexota bacterium]